jgi:hypothetical protein
MATGGLTPIRGNDAYIAGAKQAAWGTAVAPTWWFKWLDGFAPEVTPTFEEEMEGDTSPFKSIVTKNEQLGMVKIVEYARPQVSGYSLQGVMGSGSDTYTAPATSTTLSAAIVAGATAFSVPASIGTVGTVALNFTPGYAVAAYEVATADLTTKTGTGPYTYSLAAGAKFKNAHAMGDAVTSASTHAFSRQPYTFDPYTLEYAFGHNGGSPAQAWRLQDAVATELKISSTFGKKVKLEHTWYGTQTKAIAAPSSSATYEGTGVIGQAGSPFVHYQASGSWQIDGVGTGNALTVNQFDATLKNSTDTKEFITEALTPAYFQPGNFEATGTAQVVFQNFNQYNEILFGNQAIVAGNGDSYVVGFGSLLLTYAADAINQLTISLPNVYWKAPKLTPKLDGKSLVQQLQWVAIKNLANPNPCLITLSNSNAAVY